ncbi:hypothetical protein ABFS83_03G024800 [Erythranthe nasuta]
MLFGYRWIGSPSKGPYSRYITGGHSKSRRKDAIWIVVDRLTKHGPLLAPYHRRSLLSLEERMLFGYRWIGSPSKGPYSRHITEGHSKSKRKDAIWIVVDRLTKYGPILAPYHRRSL